METGWCCPAFPEFGSWSVICQSVQLETSGSARIPPLRRSGSVSLFKKPFLPKHHGLGPHRGNQGWDADDLHDAGHIVGKNVQGHLGGDVFQPPHLEVRRTHP